MEVAGNRHPSEPPPADGQSPKVVLGMRDVELRKAIGRKLEEHGGLGVAGTSSSPDRVVELVLRVQPDLVIVDEALTTAEGQIERLRATSDAAVVVLAEPGQMRPAPPPRGANAYIGMRPVDELVVTLLDVAAIADLCR